MSDHPLSGAATLSATPSGTIELPAPELTHPWSVGLVPRIVGLVASVAILTGGLIAMVMARQHRDTLLEQIIANNLASADLAAEFAYGYMEGAQMAIRLMAQRPTVRHAVLSGNFSPTMPELREFLDLNHRVDGCSIFDAKGINRATGHRAAVGLGNDAAGREWFQQIMSTREPYLGVPVASRITGRSVVPYGVPVRDPQGAVKDVVLCGISLAALNDAIAKFSPRSTARASLIDRRQGGVILGSRLQLRRSRKKAAMGSMPC